MMENGRIVANMEMEYYWRRIRKKMNNW
jgi:hypothetical protein